MKLKNLSLSVAVAGLAGLTAQASGIAWPADFWQQVTNHVSVVTPSGNQVKTVDGSGRWIYVPSLLGLSFGTTAIPFDTRTNTSFVSDETWVESFAGGTIIFIR